MKLVQIILIADNESYILFDESHVARCRREILGRHAQKLKAANSGQATDTAPDSGDQNSNYNESAEENYNSGL